MAGDPATTYQWRVKFQVGSQPPKSHLADMNREQALALAKRYEQMGIRILEMKTTNCSPEISLESLALGVGAENPPPGAQPTTTGPVVPKIPSHWVYCPRCDRPTEPLSGSFTYTGTETVRTREVGTTREFVTEVPVQRTGRYMKCMKCRRDYRFRHAHTKAQYQEALWTVRSLIILVLAGLAYLLIVSARPATPPPSSVPSQRQEETPIPAAPSSPVERSRPTRQFLSTLPGLKGQSRSEGRASAAPTTSDPGEDSRR